MRRNASILFTLKGAVVLIKELKYFDLLMRRLFEGGASNRVRLRKEYLL